jgi:hypothetical protein
MSAFGPNGPRPFDGQNMPPATRDYFKIAVNRIDAKFILQKTGLRRAAAYQIMLSLADRLTPNADGTWALPRDLTNNELNLAQCVSSVMVVKPAFEAARLFDDFVAALKSNGLITKDEIRDHTDTLRILVQLYAVAAMHNCIVQIGDGTTTQLKAKAEITSKQIPANAAVPNTLPHMPRVFISTSMFTADLDPTVHCHPDLLEKQEWDFEIEVAPDKRLSPLR